MMMELDERGLPQGHEINTEWEVSPRDAKRLLDEERAILIDCRPAEERSVARVEGSMHVPMDEIAAQLPGLMAYEETPLVVMCHRGVRSLQVTAFLREQGFENVRSVAGGIDLWSIAIDPSIPRY